MFVVVSTCCIFWMPGPATTTEQAPTYSPTDVMNYLRGMNGKIDNIVTEMQSIRTTVTTQGGRQS